MRRGFTLVELLNVVGIVAVLSAILMPVVRAAKAAAFEYHAKLSMRQLSAAVEMYMTDADDTFPLAMYGSEGALKTWFGMQRKRGGFDAKGGILAPYTSGRVARDPSHRARDHFGDGSGFGYNWGYLGSDINITLDYRDYPNCLRPARGSELSDPSDTIAFGTSAFYFAPWLKGGDGQKYDLGFIDPPKYWRGNPNVDFRFGDPPLIDPKSERLEPRGRALFVFVGGSAKSISASALKDEMFERQPRSEQQ